MWEDELKKIVKRYNIPDDTKTFLANDIIDRVESLLKKQRENCMKEYLSQFLIDAEKNNKYIMSVKNKILNAPEPTGGKK